MVVRPGDEDIVRQNAPAFWTRAVRPKGEERSDESILSGVPILTVLADGAVSHAVESASTDCGSVIELIIRRFKVRNFCRAEFASLSNSTIAA